MSVYESMLSHVSFDQMTKIYLRRVIHKKNAALETGLSQNSVWRCMACLFLKYFCLFLWNGSVQIRILLSMKSEYGNKSYILTLKNPKLIETYITFSVWSSSCLKSENDSVWKKVGDLWWKLWLTVLGLLGCVKFCESWPRKHKYEWVWILFMSVPRWIF